MSDTLPNRILVNGVTFQFTVPHEPGPHSRYDTKALGSIDRFGHVSVEPTIPWHDDEGQWRELIAERRDDMAGALISGGLAEWRDVGQGDHELYATQPLLRLLAPALAALPSDWLAWEPSDG